MKIGKQTALTAAAATIALGTALMAAAKIKPDIRKSTFPFAVRNGSALYLDKYESENWLRRRRPVILFAFGGGFSKGRRDNPQYADFFNFLARKGYVVISVDYRKGLKDLPAEKRTSMLGFLGALREAIRMAAEDYAEATRFVVDHADEWGVNPDRIIACGSSAGAITVLQTEYELCNSPEFASTLPPGFNYAGVLSFAGAIFSVQQLQWKKKPCPMMLFHGDADKRVPFRQAAIKGAGGLWGSITIAESLKRNRSPHYLYIVENASHEVCKTPMAEYRRAILEFFEKLVRLKKKVIITSKNHRSKETGIQKEFNLKEYLLNNMR